MPTDCTHYEPARIEPHWQRYWSEHRTFVAGPPDDRPKYYGLDMFPYPSGAGLHIGHPEGYTASDILCRYRKSRGDHVLHPMGWDAFGLPAEQYAVKTGTHPARTTAANIETFRRQIQQFGFAIDWTREINTTDPGYYRWTQWIFLKLFRRGLVYVDRKPVWWCPELRAVLANEEVVDGRSEVGGHPVERRALRQVVLRITAYADRLLAGLEDLDWPDSTKRQQRAWIGRSEGTEILFPVDNKRRPVLRVYTTRPDTLFGATYMVLAPEHPLVAEITTAEHRDAIEDYRRQAAAKSDLDRTDLAREKSGVFTGAHAINPINGARLPIWVADYVLASYGTGAIMAVPAHDERDYEFAETFQLPIQRVIDPERKGSNGHSPELPYTGEGFLVHSGDFSGLSSEDARREITLRLEEQEEGRPAVNYRLRDWVFSRQRYWGEPVPLVWVGREDYERAAADRTSPVGRVLPGEAVTAEIDGELRYALPVPPEELPLTLPEVESFQPSGDGESPLANEEEWLHVHFHLRTGETRPASAAAPGGDWVPARRETNTMPQWAGSCWYHLRYLDPHNEERIVDPERERYWQAPDLYIGGSEHAVLHLLYARFWHQVLYDEGVVSTPEPYRRLFHQGIILGEDGEKMSKSRGNVVNPETVIADHGADALRLFEMFLGPLEDSKPWNPQGIEGISRFLKKVWRTLLGPDGQPAERLVADGAPEDEAVTRALHATIAKVTADIENLRFNTAISQMMIFVNTAARAEAIRRGTALRFLQLLAPFAPHLAEELWERLGAAPSVSGAAWPEPDPDWLGSDRVTYAVQVNGKLRGELEVADSTGREEVLAAARGLEKVAANLEGKTLRKEVFVPGKIVNFVVG